MLKLYHYSFNKPHYFKNDTILTLTETDITWEENILDSRSNCKSAIKKMTAERKAFTASLNWSKNNHINVDY